MGPHGTPRDPTGPHSTAPCVRPEQVSGSFMAKVFRERDEKDEALRLFEIEGPPFFVGLICEHRRESKQQRVKKLFKRID